MTIQEIAEKLNSCANMDCEGCKYFDMTILKCQQKIIKEMATEIERIVKEEYDDGR